MNELQLVLLVFAVLVVAVLYWISQKNQTKSDASESGSSQERSAKSNNDSVAAERTEPVMDFGGKSGEPQVNPEGLAGLEPSIAETMKQAGNPEPKTDDDGQTSFSFGQEFEVPKSQDKPQDIEPTLDTATSVKAEAERESSPKKAKHHVLEVEELYSVAEVGSTVDDLPKPTFGKPEGSAPAATHTQTQAAQNREPQIFALLVLNTGGSGQEFGMDLVNQALLGVGLSFTQQQIYATVDSQGKEIIRVANILEPGTFPAENLQAHTTPGIALILELPTTVRAPAAMHDLIIMARKVSQRLNGRLYSIERHLIKESDLQAMRDAAVEYESEPL